MQHPQYDPELAYYPAEQEPPRITAVKQAARMLAEEILNQTSAGAHQTLSLRLVEDAVFRACYAITQETAIKELAKDRKQKAKDKPKAA